MQTSYCSQIANITIDTTKYIQVSILDTCHHG